jgi:hypothetical protein
METQVSPASEEARESQSPLPEPSDEQLRALQESARAEAKRKGVFDLPATPIAEIVRRVPTVDRLESGGDDDDLWQPPCVTCKEPIGYRCRTKTYLAQTECASCAAGSVSVRLEASGISFSERDEPLAALKPHGSDGKPYGDDWTRYMAFLAFFAALKPGERLSPPFAFVCGSNGVGKTAGAERALRDAIRNGCQGRSLRLSTILDSIYSTYGGEADESAKDRMHFFASIHLLVIQEVGKGTPKDHAVDRFFDIVDDRAANRMPTIYTSNYLPQADSLGVKLAGSGEDATPMHGILDRIRGGCGPNQFIILGKSWRIA